jgi:hypothetical protein
MDLVEATLKKPAVGTLRIYEDREALARAAAELICETAVLKPGPVRVALCGGTTPQPAYELLAQDPLLLRLPWSRVHWVLGDERFVKRSHPDSNYVPGAGEQPRRRLHRRGRGQARHPRPRAVGRRQHPCRAAAAHRRHDLARRSGSGGTLVLRQSRLASTAVATN